MNINKFGLMQRSEHERIFREWLSAHRGILAHVARGFADATDRDDLIQEMMLAVWHAIPSFRGDASASTFMYRVAQNTALTWRRRIRRQPCTETLEESVHAAAPVSAKVDRSEQLYAAIRRLPELDRALVLLYLDEISYRDMALMLGMSESNIGVRLNRIRRRLAGMINRGNHEHDH